MTLVDEQGVLLIFFKAVCYLIGDILAVVCGGKGDLAHSAVDNVSYAEGSPHAAVIYHRRYFSARKAHLQI